MSDDIKKLRVLLLTVYERRATAVRVSPNWLATEAMASLDPRKTAPELVYLAAHLQLRQLARTICRGKFEDDGEDQEANDLFPDLQTRYPAARSRDTDPEYVLLDHLAEADVRFNIDRLRKESAKKMRHADALEAWWQNGPHDFTQPPSLATRGGRAEPSGAVA